MIRGLFWHKYHHPGSFLVTASITDSQGEDSSASCTFAWNSQPSNVTWTPSGDPDSADIGREVWVGNDDPHASR